MRKITERTRKTVPNAWGGFADIHEQRFEVTAEDIGHTKDRYLGAYSKYTFTHRDVGKIVVDRETSWYFKLRHL